MATLQTRKGHRECSRRGAVLVYVLLATVMLLGMAAVAVDVAMLYGARRRAQAVADSAALATGPLLPIETASIAAANRVVTANNATGPSFKSISTIFNSGPNSTITLDDGTSLSLSGGYAITVTGYVNAPLSFGPVIGYRPTSRDGKKNTKSVSATATVIVRSACSIPAGQSMGPFGIVADDPNSNNADVAYIARLLTTAANAVTPPPNVYQPLSKQVGLKVSRWQNGSLQAGGNFGALDLGGSGGDAYRNDITTPNPRQFQVAEEVPTKTGNMVGPTDQGVTGRLDSTNTAFTHRYATYVSWFFGDQNLPVDTNMPPVTDGNQTYYYRQDPHRQELTDARVIIVPLISTPAKNGRSNAVILAFAAFFIEQPSAGQILGRFIGIQYPSGGGGTCTGGGTYQWPKLVR